MLHLDELATPRAPAPRKRSVGRMLVAAGLGVCAIAWARLMFKASAATPPWRGAVGASVGISLVAALLVIGWWLHRSGEVWVASVGRLALAAGVLAVISMVMSAV